jgi:four helix bundle protein
MTFEEWESQVPAEIKADSVWRCKAYRLAMFLADLAWRDGLRMLSNRRCAEAADQLTRATSRISANICEGYSRFTGKGRATYYEYGLGSTRESRDWYYHGRHGLTLEVLQHRLDLCTQLVRLLSTMIATERRSNRRIGE